MQLIDIVAGETMLSSVELEQHVNKRKKRKPLVIITVSKTHIQLQIKKTRKTKIKVLYLHACSGIYTLLPHTDVKDCYFVTAITCLWHF